MSATGSFGIQSRIGLGPNWQHPDFLDFQEVPPATNFVAGAPLTAPYPGIKADPNDPNGYFASEGALGYTFFKYPTGTTIVTFASGPNKDVKVLLKTSWEVEEEAGGAAAGIYVEQSLRSSDPFYQRQVGESPYCTQADIWTPARRSRTRSDLPPRRRTRTSNTILLPLRGIYQSAT